MKADLEAQAIELCDRVVGLPAEERLAFLDVQCGVGTPLRALVDELLDAEARMPDDFLEGEPTPSYAYLEPGAAFAGFRILRRIGEGGMGTVYAAMQSMPKREVALKVVRPGRVSAVALRRFHHEVEILGNLQHPGIAQIYEAGSATYQDAGGRTFEQPYLAMELVRGEPLSTYAEARELDDRARMELLARVCDAVQHAHLRGVIHRDLKAENVLVTDDETTVAEAPRGAGPGRPVVLDFGIARFVGLDAARETRAGDLLGTLSTMSPERLAGGPTAVDARSDVYSLGVMLYQLLAQRLPHELDGASLPEALRSIQEEPATPLELVHPRFRGDVSTIAAKALEKDPERRYPSALELADDLRRCVRGEPIRARSDSALYLLRRRLRRHRAGLLVAASVSVLVLAFAIVFALQAERNRVLARDEAAARRLADADFQRALGAIELLTEVGHERLAGVPAAEPARRELLQAALEFHRGLLDDRSDGPALVERRGVARLRVAQILELLGEHGECAAAARQAAAELESLEPSAERHEILAAALAALAKSLKRQGETEAAFAALDRLDEVVASWPDAAWSRSRAAAVERLRSVLHYDAGRFEEAQGTLATTVPELETLVAREPSFLNREALADATAQLGTALTEAGRWDEAVEAYHRSLELREALLAEASDRTASRYERLGTLTNLGATHERMGDLALAIETQEEAVRLAEELVADHPSVPRYRSRLADAWTNLGTARASSGSTDGSEEAFEAALDQLEGLEGEAARAARLSANVGTLALWDGRIDAADASFDAAALHAERALADGVGQADTLAVLRVARIGHALVAAARSEPEVDVPSPEDVRELLASLEQVDAAIRALEGTELPAEVVSERRDRYAAVALRLVEEGLRAGVELDAASWASSRLSALRACPEVEGWLATRADGE